MSLSWLFRRGSGKMRTSRQPLFQATNWRRSARSVWVTLVLVIVVPLVLSGGLTWQTVPGLSGLGISALAISEWRMRQMGVRFTSSALELVRPLSTTRLGWSEIGGFERGEFGGSYGIYARLNKRSLGQLGGRHVRLPAFPSTPGRKILDRWIGPCELLYGNRRIAEDEIAPFLNEQLAHAGVLSPPA